MNKSAETKWYWVILVSLSCEGKNDHWDFFSQLNEILFVFLNIVIDILSVWEAVSLCFMQSFKSEVYLFYSF